MDFVALLTHHILDHPLVRLARVDGVDVTLTKHGLMMGIAGVLLAGILYAARRQSGEVPSGMANAVEALIVFFRDEVVRPNLGPRADAYLPYFLTLFFFILLCNLLGLVPYGATATGNISVTAALALSTFGLIHVAGIRELGLWHYLGTYVPPGLPWWLVPLVFAIEVLGVFTKAFALCIRLFANMIAGHIVILAFLGLIFIFKNLWIAPLSVGAAVGLGLLEVFVGFLQAYIFTLLTAVFVGASVHPQH